MERKNDLVRIQEWNSSSRCAVVEANLGFHDAVRLAALIGGTEPRKNNTRWRTRLRGAPAEALVRDLKAHFSDRTRGFAASMLERVEEAR